MGQEAATDIIHLLKHLVRALAPYARANEIELSFSTFFKEEILPYEPALVVEWFVGTICKVISLIPPGNSIEIEAKRSDTDFIIEIKNSGIDLSRVNAINGTHYHRAQVVTLGNGTLYNFKIPLRHYDDANTDAGNRAMIISPRMQGFYSLVRKRLMSHFSKADNLVALLSDQHPADAAFLERINSCIRENMEDDQFDTAALCCAMAMSRTKLFRKLKPLIRQAPAHYIKTMRLEKAKELLESSELNICEVTYKTGFQSQSHFTKAFTRHYGVAPSLFRRIRSATK